MRQVPRPRILTAKAVDALKPDGARRLEIADGLVPGLYLVVQPSGARSWALRSRIGGKTVKITLGRATLEFGPAAARKAARKRIEAIEDGRDPRKRKAGPGAVSLPGTVGELCDRYVEQYLKKHVRRWKNAKGEIENHVKPHLGALKLDEIARGHVREMLAAIEAADKGVAANRALQRLRAVFNWGAARDLVAADPTIGVKKPTKEKPRARTLSDEELVAVWNATASLGYPARDFARFLILCGQRPSDVRCLPWSEIDLPRQDWTIAAERYKAGRPHLVPLTKGMIELLEGLPFQERSGFAFSANGGEGPYANVTKPKKALDEASGVTGWTWHDLRRTLRTGLSRLGIRPEVSERVIGHSVGGKLGQVYDTHEYRAEKLAALEAWDAHLRRLLAGEAPGNVVALREAAQ